MSHPLSTNAGIASGLTGGGMYIVSSLFSYGLKNAYGIRTEALLVAANFLVSALIGILLLMLNRYKKGSLAKKVALAGA